MLSVKSQDNRASAPLDPCHPARARELLKSGRAAIFRGCLKSRFGSKKAPRYKLSMNTSAPREPLVKAYSSNLSPDQWELREPLIPLPTPGGRPRKGRSTLTAFR